MANRRPTESLPVAVDLDRALRDAVARGGLPIPPYPAVAEGSGVRVELAPYALGGEARGLWSQLYASAGRA